MVLRRRQGCFERFGEARGIAQLPGAIIEALGMEPEAITVQTPPTHLFHQWSLKPTGFFRIKPPLGIPHFSIYYSAMYYTMYCFAKNAGAMNARRQRPTSAHLNPL